MEPIDTCCGLLCENCGFRASHNCSGCRKSLGNPFHGACPVAQCCLEKNLLHCGLCPQFPCTLLSQYSCDPVHGDTPAGARLAQCRRWAAIKDKF